MAITWQFPRGSCLSARARARMSSLQLGLIVAGVVLVVGVVVYNGWQERRYRRSPKARGGDRMPVATDRMSASSLRSMPRAGSPKHRRCQRRPSAFGTSMQRRHLFETPVDASRRPRRSPPTSPMRTTRGKSMPARRLTRRRAQRRLRWQCGRPRRSTPATRFLARSRHRMRHRPAAGRPRDGGRARGRNARAPRQAAALVRT